MAPTAITVGDLLYRKTLRIKGDRYGVSLVDLRAGKIAPPPEGARFDLAVEGVALGTRVSGKVSGVDCIHIRADRRIQLHIHEEITTEDGAFFADGVAKREGTTLIYQLTENARSQQHSPKYSWVNPVQVWGQGTYDAAKQELSVAMYAAVN